MPKHETKEQGAIRRQTASNMRKSSTFFAEADKDANQNIDFEEFYAMQPRAICKAYSVEDIKTWFDSADTNGDGTLSIDEFFLWSLGNAAVKHGSMSLTAAFEKYDKDGSGSLDAIEFGKACTEMGYGVEAYSIFQSLDEDGSGTICYREMLAKIEEGSMKVAPQAKQMLTALVWAVDKAEKDVTIGLIDTSKWRIKGETVETVTAELRQLLRDSGGHVADLIKIFDQDPDCALLIDDVEFFRTMRTKLGFRGPTRVLQDVFRMLDTDNSGAIGFDELFEFVRGRRHSLDERNKKMRAMKLELPSDCPYTLEQIAWDVETLRALMKRMLATAQVGTGHLMKVWDKSGDGELSLSEFVTEMAVFFREHPDLWTHEVAPIVEAAFEEIDLKVRHEGKSGLITGTIARLSHFSTVQCHSLTATAVLLCTVCMRAACR